MSGFPYDQSNSGASGSSLRLSLNQSSNPNSAEFALESTPPSLGYETAASPSSAPCTSPSVFGVIGSSPFIFSTTVGDPLAVSPNMSSQVETEEIVKEVIMEGNNTENEELILRRFLKQENEELKKRLKEMEEELEDKESDLEQRESLISALLVKERYTNDELLEARKLLINELRDLTDDGSKIRVKKIGVLDVKPFIKASNQRFTEEEAAVEYSKWEKNLKDPHWHPFKCVVTGNTMKEVVDEEDEKLKILREEWGEEVMNAVKTVLEEVNEFNPSGRHIVTTLWNSEQGRTATLKEAIAHMIRKNPKRRKNC